MRLLSITMMPTRIPAGVDGCMHKLERQLSEHKKKFRNRKHPDPAS